MEEDAQSLDMFDEILGECQEELEYKGEVWEAEESTESTEDEWIRLPNGLRRNSRTGDMIDPLGNSIREDEIIEGMEYIGLEEYEKEVSQVRLLDKKDSTKKGRQRDYKREYRLRQARIKEQRDRIGRSRFGKSWLDRPIEESPAVLGMLRSHGPWPRWGVSALVTLRAQGCCEVCGEQIKAFYQVLQMTPTSRGGEYVPSNCLCVCQHCAECWYPYKTFDCGMGSEQTWKSLSVAVLRRRRDEFRKVKSLDKEGYERFRKLIDEENKLTQKIQRESQEIIERQFRRQEELERVEKCKRGEVESVH